MKKLLVSLVVFALTGSAFAYYEDFEDPCDLQGTLVGVGSVSGGSLYGSGESFLADGWFPNASGNLTVNFGGSDYQWRQAAYYFGHDGVTKGYANAPAGLMVWWLPWGAYTGPDGWMYVLRNSDTGAVWQTVYIDQSGAVNPAGYSDSADYELIIEEDGATLTTWVQEAANPDNKGKVYTVDISGETRYGDRVSAGIGDTTGNTVAIKDLAITGFLIVLTETDSSTIVTEGGGFDTFAVELSEQPDSDVTVTLDPATTDISLGMESAGDPLVLTFTDGNWNTPQTVTVLAYVDALSEGQETVSVSISSDSANPHFILTGVINIRVLDEFTLILTGPQTRAVFQRDSQNMANVPVAGTVSPGLVVEGRYSPQSSWQGLDVSGTNFDGFLKVPSGGWYTIELRARQGQNTVATASVGKIGAGEVFITAGQSNSANFGSPAATPSSDLVSAWTGTGWRHAYDPQPGATGSAGSVWSRLGDLLVAEFNVPVGFLSTGVGGTYIDWWLPGSSTGYYSRIQAALNEVSINGIRAILWHQGESDAYHFGRTTYTPSATYAAHLTTIINQSRTDSGREIPWGVAIAAFQPGSGYPVPEGVEAVQAVNDGQRMAINADPNVFEGPYTDQWGIEYRNDGAHFNAAGLALHAAGWRDAIMSFYESLVLAGDFDGDGDVDLADFAWLAARWLDTDCELLEWCDGTNMLMDGTVDTDDLAEFFSQWLD